MKNTAAVIAGIFLATMVAGNALATMDNERFAGVSTTEMKSVKAMVAGTYESGTETLQTKRNRVVDLGFIALPETELETLKDMVAGNYVTQPEKFQNPNNEVVNVGKVEMNRQDYESLKEMVRAKRNQKTAPLLSSTPMDVKN